VVMVTHDPRIAAYAGRIIFLKDGAVVDETILERKSGDNSKILADKMRTFGE
jgi:putative ABC transport system ATP-binding protein